MVTDTVLSFWRPEEPSFHSLPLLRRRNCFLILFLIIPKRGEVRIYSFISLGRRTLEGEKSLENKIPAPLPPLFFCLFVPPPFLAVLRKRKGSGRKEKSGSGLQFNSNLGEKLRLIGAEGGKTPRVGKSTIDNLRNVRDKGHIISLINIKKGKNKKTIISCAVYTTDKLISIPPLHYSTFSTYFGYDVL